MQLRFPLAALTFVSLPLIAILCACSSSPQNPANTVGWRDFVAYNGSSAPGPTPALLGSVEEMERIGGFPFVFPSYLPEGVSKHIRLGALAQSTSDPTPEETVQLDSERKETPSIFIAESPCNPPCDFAGLTTHEIGDTDVSCDVSSMEMWWSLECRWTIDDKIFTVIFDWRAVDATPTDDLKREAMKVVESMILAPEHP